MNRIDDDPLFNEAQSLYSRLEFLRAQSEHCIEMARNSEDGRRIDILFDEPVNWDRLPTAWIGDCLDSNTSTMIRMSFVTLYLNYIDRWVHHAIADCGYNDDYDAFKNSKRNPLKQALLFLGSIGVVIPDKEIEQISCAVNLRRIFTHLELFAEFSNSKEDDKKFRNRWRNLTAEISRFGWAERQQCVERPIRRGSEDRYVAQVAVTLNERCSIDLQEAFVVVIEALRGSLIHIDT